MSIDRLVGSAYLGMACIYLFISISIDLLVGSV